MPSRRSDRGAAIRGRSDENRDDKFNRGLSTAVTLSPLLGLPGLGVGVAAAALQADTPKNTKITGNTKKRRKPSKDEVDSTTQLMDSILQSMEGHPLPFSMSSEVSRRDMARQAIQLILMNELMDPSTEKSDTESKADKVEKKGTRGSPR